MRKLIYCAVWLVWTLQTIIFLEPLLDYADTAGAMLLLHGVYTKYMYRSHKINRVIINSPLIQTLHIHVYKFKFEAIRNQSIR